MTNSWFKLLFPNNLYSASTQSMIFCCSSYKFWPFFNFSLYFLHTSYQFCPTTFGRRTESELQEDFRSFFCTVGQQSPLLLFSSGIFLEEEAGLFSNSSNSTPLCARLKVVNLPFVTRFAQHLFLIPCWKSRCFTPITKTEKVIYSIRLFSQPPAKLWFL